MRGSLARLPPPELPPTPRAALVVAATTYQDPAFQQLRAPATDAVEFANVLRDPDVCGFEVQTVVDRPAQEVRIAIEEFLSGRSPSDFVLLYVSCHGVKDSRGRLHFATTDSIQTRIRSTGVDSGWVNEQLDESRARTQVLILDCCFSGAFAHGAKGDESLGLDTLQAAGRGRVVLTASNEREYAFEATDPDRTTHVGGASRSVFTEALLTGLQGPADSNGDGIISVDEAYDYALSHMRAAGSRQTPQKWSRGEGQLHLARSRLGVAVQPVALPDALATSLENPLPRIREAAVEELVRWMGDDRGRTVTGREVLERIAADDIPRVARAASRLLNSAGSDTPVRADVAAEPQRGQPGPGPEVERHPEPRPEPPSEPRPEQQREPRRRVPVAFDPAVQTAELKPPGRRGCIKCIAFSGDGRLLAAGMDNGLVQVWKGPTWEHLGFLSAHQGETTALAISRDGKMLATGGSDLTVRLWQTADGKLVDQLHGYAHPIRSIAFDPSSDGLAIAGGPVLWLYDCASKAHGRSIDLGTTWTSAVAYSPEGGRVVTAGGDRRLRMWTTTGGELVNSFVGDPGVALALAYSPDGRLLASGGDSRSVVLWDADSAQMVRALSGHSDRVTCLSFSPDGRRLASGSADRTVRLWSTRRRCFVRSLNAQRHVESVAFSPGARILASGGADKLVRLWGQE